MPKAIRKQTAEFKKDVEKISRQKYSLRLYVTGMTPRSTRAVQNITKICEEYLKGRYELSIVDLYRHAAATREDDIIVAPTLIKKLPLPLKRLIGDMTSTDKILLALDLNSKKKEKPQD